MKNFLRLLVFGICMLAGLAFASDYKSETLGPAGFKFIRVGGGAFLVIRNFTQDGGTQRGVVTVNTTSGTASVLTAAILDPMNTTPGALEVINSVVIAGPADVTVTCAADATDCFVSFKKDSE
jgi:hypothetical protein